MSAIDTFKKRMSFTSGSSMRDEIVKNSKQLLQSTFLDDASANPYITFWNTETKLACRIWGRKESSGLVIATIQTFIDSTITVGDILYNSHDNEYWLCTNLFNIDDVHKQGELTLCNYTLLFQSPDGTILSYPCVDESKSSLGLDVNNTVTTLNNQHTIKVPFDDNTKLIKEDRRFFLDKYGNTTCKVTNVNNTEFNYGDKGIIVWTVQADTMQPNDGEKPKDRPDLRICNYFSPTITPTPTPTNTNYSKIVPSGSLLIGTTRTLTATAYNTDNTVNTDVLFTWVITKPSGFESLITSTISGNKCVINVDDTDNYDIIDQVVGISVSDNNNGYIDSIDMKIGA